MIDIRNLSFRYKETLPHVLKNLNLSIKPGERILVAGKNGAGKTTFSKILSGLIPDSESGILEGVYKFNDLPLKDLTRREIAGNISILLQDFETQIVSTSVREELLFYPLNLGKSYPESLDAAVETASGYGIDALYDRNIAELSGGEKQKTALASLLTAKGSFLILDEPLTDMDPVSQELILKLLEDYPGTLIVFEQSVEYYQYFDRIILLKDGVIKADSGRETAARKSILESCGLAAPPVFSVTGLFSGSIREAAAQARDIYRFDEVKYSEISLAREDRTENLIEIQNLFYKYPGSDQYALENVSLDIKKGDFITLLGENGSGKTTLMKLTAGIYKDFTKGRILYKGQDIRKQTMAGEITYVYQNPDNQIFAETVYDEIAFALRTRGESEETVREKVFGVMELFSITDKKESDPFSLPKGDREKIACASVLVAGPEVIILDEPTTGLDTRSVKALMEIITGLNKRGKTVIIITHSMETASLYGYKTAAMAGGKLLFHGDKREFFINTALLERVKAKRTPLMDLSLEMNQAFLLNEGEFNACWKKK
ncbi:MAG: hypothetical protein A2277_04395 [Desulfobacterales bacterium RIFOXYA12_FULL_46_15]|nr:MAG: hypothetical protein A2277_04395 [Desulfobacterales bacterium RIFOXYA12_FULL_46_15]